MIAERVEYPERPGNEDPRWPVKCEGCEYEFGPEDMWQVFPEVLYRREVTGEVMTLEEAPAGAMWNGDWWPMENPDGIVLFVRLPDGVDWMVDGKAGNCACPADPLHRCWTRTGQAPRVTARPSIKTSGYHGYLTDGVLSPC